MGIGNWQNYATLLIDRGRTDVLGTLRIVRTPESGVAEAKVERDEQVRGSLDSQTRRIRDV